MIAFHHHCFKKRKIRAEGTGSLPTITGSKREKSQGGVTNEPNIFGILRGGGGVTGGRELITNNFGIGVDDVKHDLTNKMSAPARIESLPKTAGEKYIKGSKIDK